MRKRKMLEMLKAGVDPIDVSIEKWQLILRSVKNSDYIRAWNQDENCALCHVAKYSCSVCPLQNCSSDGTAYTKAIDAISEHAVRGGGTKQGVIKAVEHMIKTLEDLKHEPKTHGR